MRQSIAAAAALVVIACGRSPVLDPAIETSSAAPSESTSALSGHWSHFNVGNCIYDESWLSFDATDGLTVTSVNRNACGPQSIAAVRGSYRVLDGLLRLTWSPAKGPRTIESTYAIRPIEQRSWAPEFGVRELLTTAWQPQAGGFAHHTSEAIQEDGQTYQRRIDAFVSFDGPITREGTVNAKLRWQADITWGAEPRHTLDEVFELPCRVTVEKDGWRVKARVLDDESDFWHLLQARGLERSYGFDLDRLRGQVGPEWLVTPDGVLLPPHLHVRRPYFEMRTPPPDRL